MRLSALRLWVSLHLLSGALLVLPAVIFAQSPSSPAPALQKFQPPDGRCAISMPGAPQVDRKSIPLQNGEAIQLNEYWVETDAGNISYMLLYNDYPPNLAGGSVDNLLQRSRDAAAAGKTLLDDSAITLDGTPGRAFTTLDPDGRTYTVRQYFSRGRLYQLIIVANKGYTPAYMSDFLKSFTLL